MILRGRGRSAIPTGRAVGPPFNCGLNAGVKVSHGSIVAAATSHRKLPNGPARSDNGVVDSRAAPVEAVPRTDARWLRSAASHSGGRAHVV